jgi:hypothetical protein
MIASAKDDIALIAERLGARLKRCGPNERAGPCPRCGGRDRFSVNIKKQVFNCRGCGVGGDIIALVRHVTGFSYPEALRFIGEERSPWMTQPPRPEPPKRTDDGGVARAMSIWNEGIDPKGTLVEKYLNGRGLELGDDIAGDVLRWHLGGHRDRPGSVGSMVALLRCISTDEPKAISRRYLDREGRKIGPPLFLAPVAGAAIKLDADEELLGGVHGGEGIETCMAARQLGLRPTWALGSKGAIGSFPVLSGVECLTILAEPDAGKEIEACAARWHTAGRKIFINEAVGGKDLNDAIRSAAP